MKTRFWLILILLLSLLLRLYRLDLLELFGDELDVGYHAYSLLTTGKDYMGNALPFYIHSFSEWRAPLLMYTTVPFVGLFGLNEWGVRLPAAVFGVVNVVLLYFLARVLSKDERLSLISAFILTVTPWHIHYSRAAFEVTLLLSLILGGTICFLRGRRYWWLSALLFGLCFYTYNTANLFLPFWLIVLALVYRKEIGRDTAALIKPGLVFVLFSLPVLVNIVNGRGSARFRLISIFNNPETIDQIVFKRTTGLENQKIERVFHNKATGWGREFITNYLTSFSPQFLFLRGDLNSRHSLPGFGQLYWLMAVFIIIGLVDFIKRGKREFKRLVFSWLFIAPIASSLTVGGGDQATRLFLMLPPLAILAGKGVERLRSGFLIFISLFLLFICLAFWGHEYLVHYPKEEYLSWDYGYKEAIGWLRENEGDYQRVIINNSRAPALIRYLFWARKSPAWLQNNFQGDKVRENLLSGFNGFRLGKVVFGNIAREDKLGWLEENLDRKTVYLAFQLDEVPGDWDWQKDPPAGLKVLQAFDDPWGRPMAYWLTKEDE